MNMVCHIELHDGTNRRVEIDAPDRKACVRMAFGMHPTARSVSPRAIQHDAIVLDGLGAIKEAAAFLGVRA